MAHVNFHLATGLLIGSAVTTAPMLRMWILDRPMAIPLLRSLIVSFTLAVWASIPNLLTMLGVASGAVHRSWWADLFLGHAAVDRRVEGGLLIGEVVIAGYLTAMYLLVLLAIRRARRRLA